MRRYDYLYLLLCTIFVTSLVVANTLVFKLFDVNLPIVGTITLSAGILPYPVTFLCTDLISELYGRRRANALVMIGFVASMYMLLLLQLGGVFEVSSVFDDAKRVEIAGHYQAVFGQSVRAILASMMAYLTAQFIDVWLFHFWKELTKGKHLWLRNNASTMVSQLVDTVAVVTILFAGVLETDQLITIIGSSYLFKLLVAATDTPLFYLGARLFSDIAEETERRQNDSQPEAA